MVNRVMEVTIYMIHDSSTLGILIIENNQVYHNVNSGLDPHTGPQSNQHHDLIQNYGVNATYRSSGKRL